MNENQSINRQVNETDKNQSISEKLKLQDLDTVEWKIRKLNDNELEAIVGGCYAPPA